MALPSYRRHRFPPEIIQNAIASAVPGRNGSTKSNSTATACIRPSIAARCGYSPAPDSIGRINIRRSPRRCRHLGAAMSRRHRTNSGEEVRFAQDSPLEERVSSEPVSEIGSDSGTIMGDSGS
jgi:hypothetical protein